MPSPPQARIRRLCTRRYISSLGSEGGNGVRGVRTRELCPESAPGQLSPPPPQSPGRYLRLPGAPLAQVKDLPGIQIPEEGLDDLGALWETRSRQGSGEAIRVVGRGGEKRVGPGRGKMRRQTGLSPHPWEKGVGPKPTWEHLLGGGAELDPTPPQGSQRRLEAVCTWLPPLLEFTNTSRGFMRGDGVGLMMKGLQRPSLETERARKAGSHPGRPSPCSLCPRCPREYHRRVRPHSGPGPRGGPGPLPLLGGSRAQIDPATAASSAPAAGRASVPQETGPPLLFPSGCPPGPRSNLRPFLARLPLEGCSFFLLAGFEGVLRGKWRCG